MTRAILMFAILALTLVSLAALAAETIKVERVPGGSFEVVGPGCGGMTATMVSTAKYDYFIVGFSGKVGGEIQIEQLTGCITKTAAGDFSAYKQVK